VFKSLTSVQLVPFQDSVSPDKAGVSVPAAIAFVLVPKPAPFALAVFKSATSVQAEPFQFSVYVVCGTPPKANAAVEEAPAPLILSLAVFKSPVSVQELPFQTSAFV
jgi:hypothetical protein